MFATFTELFATFIEFHSFAGCRSNLMELECPRSPDFLAQILRR